MGTPTMRPDHSQGLRIDSNIAGFIVFFLLGLDSAGSKENAAALDPDDAIVEPDRLRAMTTLAQSCQSFLQATEETVRVLVRGAFDTHGLDPRQSRKARRAAFHILGKGLGFLAAPYLAELVVQLQSPDAFVRFSAVQALQWIGCGLCKTTIGALVALIVTEGQNNVFTEATTMLSKLAFAEEAAAKKKQPDAAPSTMPVYNALEQLHACLPQNLVAEFLKWGMLSHQQKLRLYSASTQHHGIVRGFLQKKDPDFIAAMPVSDSLAAKLVASVSACAPKKTWRTKSRSLSSKRQSYCSALAQLKAEDAKPCVDAIASCLMYKQGTAA